jgi:phosphoglycolate phosphatase-like HAD superfamily hydrolase
MKSEFEMLKYRLACELIENFFHSVYYITFNSIEEVECFLKFINQYDKRYNANFYRKDEIKSVMWKYSKNLYKHHLEWSNKEHWFEKYESRLLRYEDVEPYISFFNSLTINSEEGE